MNIFLEVTFMFYLTGLGDCGVSYNYEKINNFGAGKRIIPHIRRQIQAKQTAAQAHSPPHTSSNTKDLKPLSFAINPVNNFQYPVHLLEGHPQLLPSSPQEYKGVDPWPSIRQGKRAVKDVRVFKKSFEYPASMAGHKVTCDDSFDCTLNYLAIETENGIPIILRGGAGYDHFTVVVRARAGHPLVGTIKAWCIRKEAEDTWKI